MPTSVPTGFETRRRWLIAAGAVTLLAGAGCAVAAGGPVRTETRPVGAFEAIEVLSPIDLVVRQAGQPALELSADEDVLPLIETRVEDRRHGRTLSIRLRSGHAVNLRAPIRATVDVVTLRALSAKGSGSVEVGALQTPALRLSLAGSGSVRFDDLSADELEISVAGSGDVVARGKVAKAKVSIAGSGDVDMTNLAADAATVSIAGSGDAKVTANESLRVSIAGSGDVEYGGNATAVRTSVVGSGQVTKR